ncbi:uncharacterized protein LOC129751087 [Uranotaenia lowii]|uniref:uncharacterized protein LOC129751087 n=1 Tax=Uranotaenia lowii TaxID=190385 RepID=UPI0024793F78|nr:uncharacterized protein LOC129751087 [Uranotaenia lowii]
MGLARATNTTNVIEGTDAVVEMAPALTEPLSQSKLSSSATSGASPRTTGSTVGTETAPTETSTSTQSSPQDVPSSASSADSGLGTASTNPSETDVILAANTSSSSSNVDPGVLDQAVDDIQNNNSSGSQLFKIDPDSGKDLIELELEQLHRDADGAAPVAETEAVAIEVGADIIPDEISQAVIDQLAQASGSGDPGVSDETPAELQQLDSQSSIISSSSTAMGLQKDYLKDNPDMEQMLGELASTSDMELLQVFKSLEGNSGGDGLCAELAGGLSLFNDVDTINIYEEVAQATTPNKDRERMEMHAEIVKRQVQMQRKYDFLIRRLNKLQARYMGQHVSEEIAGLFEYSQRYWKKKDKEQSKGINSSTASPESLIPDIIPFQPYPLTSGDRPKPISANAMKTFAKRLEGIATTQCSTQTKRIYGNRYFQGTTSCPADVAGPSGGYSGTPTSSNISNTIPKYEDLAIDQLEQTAGLLHAELKQVQSNIDSEATLSSSGGESADEMVMYNNMNQQSLTIAKRAAWRWAKDRASVAARWTWLLAQISDLEYRIRQHNELHNKIKINKGTVTLEDPPVVAAAGPSQQSVNGYRGTLPGNSKPLDDGYDAALGSSNPNGAYDQGSSGGGGGSCRTRPFHRNGFRKRKLLQTANLHTISKKASRPSTMKCGCAWPLHPCALCTGRQDPTAPRDLPDTMPASDRVALLDPCFHPVLSFPEDVSHSVHFEAIMRIPDWQNKMIRCSAKTLSKALSQKAGISSSGVLPSAGTPAFLSSGDEGAQTGKKFGTDGKRKYVKSGKYADPSNNRIKKSKSRRNLLLANTSGGSDRGRKSLYPPAIPGTSGSHQPYGGYGNNSAGSSSNKYYKSTSSKYRKMSHSSSAAAGYEYGDSAGGLNQDGAGSGSSRSKNSSPTPNHHRNDRRNRKESYDIDNIVIPYSVAASNRVEILQYKEITTPKWRIMDEESADLDDTLVPNKSSDNTVLATEDILNASQLTKTDSGNGSTKSNSSLNSTVITNPAAGSNPSPKAPIQILQVPLGQKVSSLSLPTSSGILPSTVVADVTRSVSEGQLIVLPAIDDEDISDDTILAKHERALQEERRKFQTYMKFPWSRPRANRRADSRAESTGPNTPDAMSPAPPTPLHDPESNTSPACPSTPLTPLDSLELSETNVINALNQSLSKKERRRTMSNKTIREGEVRRSSTPDIKEIVPPYESLQFPLPDDMFEEMVRLMPTDHLDLVEDAIRKLTRPDRPNNNLLLASRNSSINLVPSSSGLLANPLSSNHSTTSTTLSATENDLDDLDDDDDDRLMQAKKVENQIIMERLLKSCDESRMYGADGGRPGLGEEDPMEDDEETDTGESLFVEEDDPNDPEWYDRPGRGRT